MGERPGFLTVTYSGSGLDTLGHEKKMVREKDVKFDGEDGSFELTDIRLVWIKKPSRWGGAKKFGALAAGVAAGVAVGALGDQMGGLGGRAVRSIGRGMTYAAVGVAVSSWTRDSYYNKDKDGNTETIAIPVLAVSQAAQSGDKLVVELKSGGNMQFKFRQKKVIPSIIANISSAQDAGKCPYCGANAGNALACPKCGAPIEGGTAAPSGGGGGGSGFCTNCGNPLDAGDRFCGKCGQSQ
ncbi:MAG: zinc ribbon domain-containing protein [Candidatus Thorarchaeota archaeon]